MTVKELIKQLKLIENQDLEVYIEQGDKRKEGVYLVYTPIKNKHLPKNCVVIN